MKKEVVLVIEDEFEDYKKICEKCSYAVIPNYKNKEENTTDEAHRKVNEEFLKMRRSIQNIGEDTIFEYVEKLIKENYKNIRCIVCDLELFGQKEKGGDIIHHIRGISIERYPDFSKYVPIIIVTRHRGEPATTALLKGGDTYIPKSRIDLLNNSINRNVKKFRYLCDNFILKKEFKVGLTFTGKNKNGGEAIEHRSFVKEIAYQLASEYGKNSVFFDEFHDGRLNGLKADQKLNTFYCECCEWIVVFLSEDYATTNEWTGIEWKAVKEYAKNNSEKIIFVRLEKFNPSELLKQNTIYKDAAEMLNMFLDGKKTPEEKKYYPTKIAKFILAKMG